MNSKLMKGIVKQTGLFIMLTIVLSSCAAIFLPRQQNVKIESQEDGVSILLNNKDVGTGDAKVLLDKRKGFYYLSPKAGEFRKNEYILSPYRRHWFYYPSFLVGIPFIYPPLVDFASPNTFVFPKKVILPVKPDLPKRKGGQREIYVDRVLTNKLEVSKMFIHSRQKEKMFFEIEEEILNAMKTEPKGNEKEVEDVFYNPNEAKNARNELTNLQLRALGFLSGAGYFDTTFKIASTTEQTIFVECQVQNLMVAYLVDGGRRRLEKVGPYYDMSIYPLVLGMKSTWFFKDEYGKHLDSLEIFGVSNHSFVQVFADVVSSAFDHSFIDFMNHDKTQELLNKKLIFGLSASAPLMIKPNQDPKMNSLEDIGKATVHIETEYGSSSGYFISNDGHILTSMSIINPNDQDIKVFLQDGKELEAKIERYHQGENLAVLKCEFQSEHYLLVKQAPPVYAGQEAYVIGSPITKELKATVLHGIVSAQRNVQNKDFIQINIGLSPGISGSPLIVKHDNNYFLAGMAIAKLGGNNVESLGFALSNQFIVKTLNIQY